MTKLSGLSPLSSAPVLLLVIVVVVVATSSSCVEVVDHVLCDRFTLGPTHLDRIAIVDSTVDAGEAEELLAVQKPSTLGHEAMLARDPLLDFLIRGTLAGASLVARMRVPVSLIVIANAHMWLGPSV